MLPWGQMLRAALSGFGIAPSQFWALSLLEWRSLNSVDSTHADRSTLRALMQQFPDLTQQVK